jgi:hypothetical protein
MEYWARNGYAKATVRFGQAQCDTSLSAFDLVMVEFRIDVVRAGRSWLGLGLKLGEGLGGLGQDVGEGLVAIHIGATGTEFSRALLAQSFGDDQADHPSDSRRLSHIGFGRALNHRGSLRLGGGKRARDDVEDEAHTEAVTGPLEAVNGTAAEFKCGGSVAREECDPDGPSQVEGAIKNTSNFAMRWPRATRQTHVTPSTSTSAARTKS